jgi:hypothetical protein
MKLKILGFLLFLSQVCLAQSDTTTVYYTKEGRETTKDSANTFIRFHRLNDVWHGREYYAKSNALKSEGNYAEMNVKIPIGDFNNYYETGSLEFAASYFPDGKPRECTYFFKNGKKKSWIIFDEKGVKQQKGWDESGKEIKDYIVMREASYKGGSQGWQKYLAKAMNRNVALDAGAPPGTYIVEVAFKINADGYISHVKAITVPSQCKPCAAEAVNAIMNSKEWNPSIFQNKAVDISSIQPVSFIVPEDKKKK